MGKKPPCPVGSGVASAASAFEMSKAIKGDDEECRLIKYVSKHPFI